MPKQERMVCSLDGRPVYVDVTSNHLVLIDPLALDGLSDQLVAIADADLATQSVQLRALGEYGLRIGLRRVPGLTPGTYEIDPDSFEPVDPESSGDGVFDIDSGTVIAIDLNALAAVAKSLTYDRYDSFLRTPLWGYTSPDDLVQELGGPFFAIVFANADRPFAGDGSYQFRPGTPKRVS